MQDQVRHVTGPGIRGDLPDRAKAGPQQRDKVRSEIPQPALLPPPGRVERVALGEGRAEPDGVSAGPPPLRHRREPGPHVGLEPRREEHDRRDSRVRHGPGQGLRGRLRCRDRLLEQQVPAGGGGAGR